MSRFLERLIRKAYEATKPVIGIVNNIALVAFVGMMFLITVDVSLRKILNMPILGSYEIVQYMMVVAISFGMAYCGLNRGHINVEVVITHLPKRVRAIMCCITGFLTLAIGIIVVWQAFVYLSQLQGGHKISPVLIIPVYPFAGIVAFGLALYAIVLLIHFWEFLLEVIRTK